MHVASMDIWTAFDVVRPQHIANIVGDHDVHGWDHSGIFYVRCLSDTLLSNMSKANSSLCYVSAR